MALAADTHLGPYETLAPLGAGGMGEVCRARDGKLGREVALKLLPDAFAGDAERRSPREALDVAKQIAEAASTSCSTGRPRGPAGSETLIIQVAGFMGK
jgi:serine/threonine protein kinase